MTSNIQTRVAALPKMGQVVFDGLVERNANPREAANLIREDMLAGKIPPGDRPAALLAIEELTARQMDVPDTPADPHGEAVEAVKQSIADAKVVGDEAKASQLQGILDKIEEREAANAERATATREANTKLLGERTEAVQARYQREYEELKQTRLTELMRGGMNQAQAEKMFMKMDDSRIRGSLNRLHGFD